MISRRFLLVGSGGALARAFQLRAQSWTPAAPRITLSVEDATLLRQRLLRWNDKSAVTDPMVIEAKEILRQHPVLGAGSVFQIRPLPASESALDSRGGFSGKRSMDGNDYRRIVGSLEGRELSIRLGGRYREDGSPVLSPGEVTRARQSLAATTATLAAGETLLGGGALFNGEGCAVIIQGKAGLRLLEGPADGKAWTHNPDVEIYQGRGMLSVTERGNLNLPRPTPRPLIEAIDRTGDLANPVYDDWRYRGEKVF